MLLGRHGVIREQVHLRYLIRRTAPTISVVYHGPDEQPTGSCIGICAVPYAAGHVGSVAYDTKTDNVTAYALSGAENSKLATHLAVRGASCTDEIPLLTIGPGGEVDGAGNNLRPWIYAILIPGVLVS